jgi:hypothetical protein
MGMVVAPRCCPPATEVAAGTAIHSTAIVLGSIELDLSSTINESSLYAGRFEMKEII